MSSTSHTLGKAYPGIPYISQGCIGSCVSRFYFTVAWLPNCLCLLLYVVAQAHYIVQAVLYVVPTTPIHFLSVLRGEYFKLHFLPKLLLDALTVLPAC